MLDKSNQKQLKRLNDETKTGISIFRGGGGFHDGNIFFQFMKEFYEKIVCLSINKTDYPRILHFKVLELAMPNAESNNQKRPKMTNWTKYE